MTTQVLLPEVGFFMNEGILSRRRAKSIERMTRTARPQGLAE